MTRLDVAAHLQLFFNNTIYYDTQTINDSLQDGVDEICSFTGCIFRSAVLPFQQNKTYYDLLTLLPDYIGVVAVFNSTIRRWMFPQSLKKFWQARIDWDAIGGAPYYFSVINHRYMAIFMKPLTAGYGNMILFYRASAPQLGDGTLIPIPDEHITALEDYSTVDLWEQAQEWSKAKFEFEKYKEDLEQLRVLVRNQRESDRYMSLR